MKIDDITLIIQYTGLTTRNETSEKTAWDFIEYFWFHKSDCQLVFLNIKFTLKQNNIKSRSDQNPTYYIVLFKEFYCGFPGLFGSCLAFSPVKIE